MNILKFKFLLKILFFLTVVGCGKIDYKQLASEFESITLNCYSLIEVEGITYFIGEPFTGSCLMFNGENKAELQSFENGLLNGLQIGYYPNGEIFYVGYRKNGEIHDKFIRYHLNGEIETEGQFSEGFYRGIFKFYDENGKLLEIKKYNKLGVMVNNKIF